VQSVGREGERRRLRSAAGPRARADARASAGAFSVFELMNFLALAGVLSAVGMYALARYVRHAKTAEAVGSLETLAHQSAAFYDASDATQPVGTTPDALHAMRHFPASSILSVPPRMEDVRARKYQSSAADWAASPWRDLQFSIPQPQYYVYAYNSEGSGATAKATITARADLDGDGVESKYSVTIAPDGDFHARVGAVLKDEGDE
jgi:Tfp pilus assembly protein PilE